MKAVFRLVCAACCWTAIMVAAEPVAVRLDAPEVRRQLNNTTRKLTETGELVFQHAAPAKSWIGIPIDPALIAGRELLFSVKVGAEGLPTPVANGNGIMVQLHYTKTDGREQFLRLNVPNANSPLTRHSLKVFFPEGVKKAGLDLALLNVSGTVRFCEPMFREALPVKDFSKFTVAGATDREEALYRENEPMKFRFQALNDGKPVEARLRLVRAGDDGKEESRIIEVAPDRPLEYVTSLDRPGYVMVRAMLLDENGEPVRRVPRPGAGARPVQYGLAAGVAPEKLRQGVPKPEDFDAFWQEEIRKLAAVPLKVLEKKAVESDDAVDVFDVKISCAGDRPVSGYLTVPKAAKEGKKFPLRLRFDGYSVQSAPLYRDSGYITFSVNPHGIENGREAAYYRELQHSVLAGYGFRNEENQSPLTTYFHGMILRGLRAAEFIKTLPEWDGKKLEIIGGSQGAFQSVAVAGLTGGVTGCSIQIPWFCDLGGIKVGRVRGWRPDPAPGLLYYDTVNFAGRVRCPVRIDAGLSDWVCPPSGVRVLYNNLRCDKELIFRQGLDHAVYFGYDRNATPRVIAKEAGK